MRAKLLVSLLALASTLVKSENQTDSTELGNTNLNYRLPNETYPEQYEIKITTNVHNGTKQFEGEVIIDIFVVNQTSEFVLHALDLEVLNATITNPAKGLSKQLSYSYNKQLQFLILTQEPQEIYAAKTKWKLAIKYKGELRVGEKGFGLYKYVDDEGKDHYLAATHFESTYARRAFPCYDEPDKRANFTITINHDPTYRAIISNMPVNIKATSPGQTVFLTTARIPTYIVAFVVSDFKFTRNNFNLSRIYSRPSVKRDMKWVLSSGKDIIEYFSNYFDIKFMLPKLNHVAIPDFVTMAMENWGLTIFSEASLLYNEVKAGPYARFSTAKNLAASISKQWLGDYVTIEWWTYLWLKAGLADLFAYKALDSIHPAWDIWQIFDVEEYHTAMEFAAAALATPISSHATSPNEIKNLYNQFSFTQAICVSYMWNNALSEKVFQEGMQNFLKKNQYSAVTEEQLFAAIQNVTAEENLKLSATVGEMMSTWTQQSGYPLLTITRNYKTGSFKVKQEDINYRETTRDNITWYVPFNYAVASNPDFNDTKATHYLKKETDMNVHAKIENRDWLLVDKQSTGFYRIQYDEANYKLLTDCLIKTPSKIPPRNRAKLMRDAYYLVTSSRLDNSILLKMLTYLKKEDQYAPWEAANFIILRYYSYLRTDSDFNLFIADLVRPIFNKLGVNSIRDEHLHNKLIRSTVIDWACAVGLDECLTQSNQKLQAFVRDNIPIESDLEGTISCCGLMQAGEEEFNFFYLKLKNSTDELSREQLISYLGCTRNKTLIGRLIFNEFPLDVRVKLLSSVYIRGGIETCIDILDETDNNSNSLLLDEVISNMAPYVLDNKVREKYLALVDKVKPSLKLKLAEKIQSNLTKSEKQANSTISWIKAYRGGNSS